MRYRNVQDNPRAMERFRIAPEVIWSWGIDRPAHGIPEMERRRVKPADRTCCAR